MKCKRKGLGNTKENKGKKRKKKKEEINKTTVNIYIFFVNCKN